MSVYLHFVLQLKLDDSYTKQHWLMGTSCLIQRTVAIKNLFYQFSSGISYRRMMIPQIV